MQQISTVSQAGPKEKMIASCKQEEVQKMATPTAKSVERYGQRGAVAKKKWLVQTQLLA
jgi:hypothetical protein